MKETILSLITSILVVAIIALIISRSAKTAEVITAFGDAFGNILNKVLSPVNSQNKSGVGGIINTLAPMF